MSAERPTYNQIKDQHDAGHKEATMLIRRRGRSIDVGTVSGSPVRGSYFVEVSEGEKKVGYKPVVAEGLSDESQAKLARELGGPLRDEEDAEQSGSLRETPHQVGHEALAIVGIEEPTGSVEQDQSDEDRILAEYNALVKDLSENDKVALWWYVEQPYSTGSNWGRMSYGLQQNHQLIAKAREVYGRLKKVRETIRE